MSGIKFLYISFEGEVYSIPTPKRFIFKAVPQLANQSVLLVDLYYETRDRKPWRLIHFDFDRIQLDEHGEYKISNEESKNHMYNFFNFGLTTAEELSMGDKPLPIPKAITVPSAKEKDALVSYS